MATDPDGLLIAAKERLLSEALNVLQCQFIPANVSDSDASAEYADEQLALAARDYAAHVGNLPPSARPVGWEEPVVLSQGQRKVSK